MEIIHIRTHMLCSELSEKLKEFLSGLCDLPHVLTHAHDHIHKLAHMMTECVGECVSKRVCDHLHAHTQYLMQYNMQPDQHVLVSWQYATDKFLNDIAWNTHFKDYWKAHVHLLMLHAQAHHARDWDQEQACWFEHGDICELMQVEFRSWLQEKYFDHVVTLDRSLD